MTWHWLWYNKNKNIQQKRHYSSFCFTLTRRWWLDVFSMKLSNAMTHYQLVKHSNLSPGVPAKPSGCKPINRQWGQCSPFWQIEITTDRLRNRVMSWSWYIGWHGHVSVKGTQEYLKFTVSSQIVVIFHSECCTQSAVIVTMQQNLSR